MAKSQEKLVLIDGNSLLNRAFYATPLFTTKDGFPSNGIFGFLKLLFKIISDKKPEYLAVAFDLHAPTFRHKMYDDYKAGRKPMPEELVAQVPVLKEVLRLMRIEILEKEGYEADDIIGTMSRKFPVHAYIYTGDRDSYQLVSENTSVCFTKRGVSDLLELTSENFADETGLEPSQIIDLKALMGDKSDNIPGVGGIGEQTAKNLLTKYDTLGGVYEHLAELTAGVRAKLEKDKEQAYLSYTLATIDVNVPLDCTLSDCVLKMPFPYAVRRKFAELDFRSLATMDVFEEEEASGTSAQKNGGENFICESKICETIEDAAALYNAATDEKIACTESEGDFRFLVQIEDKYVEGVLNIKKTLLDPGFFADALTPVYKMLGEGKRTLILYDSKAFLHHADERNIRVSAPYEDVGLMKYISDGTASSDTLSYLLDANGYPAAFPALGLYRLYLQYLEKLGESEKKLYDEIELPLVAVLFNMEKTGVCVNTAVIDELSARYDKELREVSAKIYELAGEQFNLNSPVQLGKILFDKLHIGGAGIEKNAAKTKAKKNYGTSAEILEKYADDNEIVRYVLRFRQIQKLNSTYVEGIRPLICEGKVHTTYNQSSTTTGRLSSANPNLQNIPVRTEEGKELRKLFVASKGNVLVDADYSQIELRLLAHFSDCKALREAYKNGKDIHAITASQVFGVPLDRVTPQMRREAKAVNFGIIYGISAFGLSKDLGISAKAAKSYIDKYFETYDEVKNYIDKNVENAKRDGFVTTLYGRKREITELKSSNFAVRSFGERAAMNMPLQGTSADIIKIAMIRVYNRMKSEGLKAELVLQVHDELVVDCPLEEKEKVKEILKYEMEHAAALKVPLEAEIGEGESWFDAH